MTYIYDTLTSSSAFWQWLQASDDYRHNNSYEGAKAIFEYYESLAEDTGEPIEFDPIAWCCEWSEYESCDDPLFKTDYPDHTIKTLSDNTFVISEEPLIFQAF